MLLGLGIKGRWNSSKSISTQSTSLSLLHSPSHLYSTPLAALHVPSTIVLGALLLWSRRQQERSPRRAGQT